MASWDPTRFKAQLRLTAQRLGQLQQKMDSQGQITRRDIATLLAQNGVALARAKAQKVVHEDARGDVLETLAMQLGILLEHFGELEQRGTPGPVVVEAASSIIYAAPQIDSKELQAVRDVLAHRLGPDFARSATGNREGYVAPRIVRGLNAPPPSAAYLDELMYDVAKTYGVKWAPPLRPHQKLNALSEILDPESLTPTIDIPRLQAICSSGIPGHPPWLRPRIWRVFFGTLPKERASWEIEARKQRESYYDLIRRLLGPFSSLPHPTTPLSTLDANLMDAYQQLSRVPPALFSELEDESEASDLCPLDDSAPAEIRIACASSLDARLTILRKGTVQEDHHIAEQQATPESPHPELEVTPEISITAPDLSPVTSTFPAASTAAPTSASAGSGSGPAQRKVSAPTTLLRSRSYTAGVANAQHVSALLRLLYVHARLNPAHRAPHVASLLVPLYSALTREAEPLELAHAEADTFWVFEALVAEFADLEDEERGAVWARKLSERLRWADDELYANLQAKGLDPALPHYSQRWLAPLLAHTLPLPAVFAVWDALFSRPPSTRDSNPRIEHLVDICTSMLIRARGPLFMLGKTGQPGQRAPSLWGEENAVPSPSPMHSWELGDAFLEGMSLLQVYPTEAAGGVDGILQTALDLLQRREAEAAYAQPTGYTFGARLKDTMWRGLGTRAAAPLPEVDERGEEHYASHAGDDGNETEKALDDSTAPLTTRWADKVWKGITNQTAMEVPPTPISPSSPASSASSSPPESPFSPSMPVDSHHPTAAPRAPSIWGYASKIKDSDTAAALSKVSSNWTARAMDAWVAKPAMHAPSVASVTSVLPVSPVAALTGMLRRGSVSSTGSQESASQTHSRHESGSGSGTYTPPPRPAFFRPPRDSMMPSPRDVAAALSPTSPELTSPQSDSGLASRAKHLQESFSSLTGLAMPAPKGPKTGPRPLLLGSANGHTPRRSITPTPQHARQWSEATKSSPTNRDSLSSVSSLAPSDGRSSWKGRPDWDSDTAATKVVPLRRAVSPMAPGFRATPGSRPPSGSSVASSDFAGPHRARENGQSPRGSGWGRVEDLTSPTYSSPTSEAGQRSPDLQRQAAQRTATFNTLEAAARVAPKTKPQPPRLQVDDTSDSSAVATPSKVARVRSKRFRPAQLHIAEPVASPESASPSLSASAFVKEPDSLRPEWPEMPSDGEPATTPRAGHFEEENRSSGSGSPPSNSAPPRSPIKRVRKVSSNSGEAKVRKGSGDTQRPRKISTERRPRDSAAEEGDDEGYDDLLSAYESEDGEGKKTSFTR